MHTTTMVVMAVAEKESEEKNKSYIQWNEKDFEFWS